MKIIFSIFVVFVLSSIVVLDACSEDVLEKKISKDILYKQMRNQYLRKIDKADLLERRALEYNESKYGVNSVETLKPLEALAWMTMEQQDYKEAEILYRRVIKIRKELLPRSDDNIKELGVIYFMLGDTYLYRSQYTRAIASYDESLSFAIDRAQRYRR